MKQNLKVDNVRTLEHIHTATDAIIKWRLTQHHKFWFILWGMSHVMRIRQSQSITSAF